LPTPSARLHHRDEAAGIDEGRLRLTDSRGLPVATDEALVNGAIYRVVAVRERLDGATA